jgi:RNA polymerase sigma factor (sigma-70 family)
MQTGDSGAHARTDGGSVVAALLTDAAGGDRQAWNSLVDHFGPMVWGIARSHRLNASDASDVSQTVWLRLVEHLDRIEQPDRIGAWLATTARHESLRLLRVGERQVPVPQENIADLDKVRAPAVDVGMLTVERDKQLWEAFALLPARCQEMLRLLTADMPVAYRDLGAALGMPVGSIGPTRARCLQHLRQIAVQQGLLLEWEDASRPC